MMLFVMNATWICIGMNVKLATGWGKSGAVRLALNAVEQEAAGYAPPVEKSGTLKFAGEAPRLRM